MPHTSTIIGIDGGGTSTRAIAVDSDGALIGTGRSGPSNPNNTSFESAASAILVAIDAALCGKNPPTAALCAGIAGIATNKHREQLEAALLQQRPQLAKTKLRITHDLEIAHYAAFEDNPGAVLIAGTGSACYARNAKGEIQQISGRSHEDPGSGYAIGKQAIQSKLLPHPSPPSSELHNSQFTLHNSNASRSSIAALAKEVIKMAESGNAEALGILKAEAKRLLQLIEPIPKDLPIALVGSLIESDTLYRTISIDLIQRRFPNRTTKAIVHPPQIGALQQAWKQVNKKPLPKSTIDFSINIPPPKESR